MNLAGRTDCRVVDPGKTGGLVRRLGSDCGSVGNTGNHGRFDFRRGVLSKIDSRIFRASRTKSPPRWLSYRILLIPPLLGE